MAICGNCGRPGTPAQIRACHFENKLHGEREGYMPKIKWGAGITAEAIDEAPEQSGSRYEGDLPPAGTYTFQVESFKFQESSGGNPMVAIRWAVAGETGDKAQYNGAPWFDNIVVAQQTMWKVKALCAALGVSSKDFLAMVHDEDGNIAKIGTKPTIGMRIRARVNWQPNQNGEQRLNFGSYFKPKEEGAPGDSKKKGKKDKAGKKGKKAADDAPPF